MNARVQRIQTHPAPTRFSSPSLPNRHRAAPAGDPGGRPLVLAVQSVFMLYCMLYYV